MPDSSCYSQELVRIPTPDTTVSVDLEVRLDLVMKLVAENWTNNAANYIKKIRDPDSELTRSELNDLLHLLSSELHNILDVLYPKTPNKHPRRDEALRNLLYLTQNFVHRTTYDINWYPLLPEIESTADTINTTAKNMGNLATNRI